MSKFCGKCGSTLNDNGLCQKCDAAQIAAENEKQAKAAEEQRKAALNNDAVNNKNNSGNQQNGAADNSEFADNYNQNNTCPKELTKKEKKVKQKADKAAAKVKNKADSKIADIKAQAREKANGKSDKAAARITKKADKKADKIALKSDEKAAQKAAKAAKKASRTAGRKIGAFLLKLLAIILAIAILFSAVSGVLVYFNIADVPVISDVMDFFGIKNEEDDSTDKTSPTDKSDSGNSENTEGSYEETMPDADEYYNNNAKIVSEVEADKSDEVTSEKESLTTLSNLGFNDYPVTTEYSIGGEYYDAKEITASSSEKHPIYETYYVNTNGDVWTVFLINGVVMANPVTYNLQSTLQAQLVISETDSVMSYDSATNKFYETIPNESELIVKKVDKINAETLNKLTVEGIDEL